MKNDGSRTHPPQGCGRGCDIGGIGLGEGDGDCPGILPPMPTPGMLWVAPQERSVNVLASNTTNAIFRWIISALHSRRLGLCGKLMQLSLSGLLSEDVGQLLYDE